MSLLDHFGQPAIRQQMDVLLEGNRLPHAMLFYGEPGSGMLPGALSLANDILCTEPLKGKACRQCPSCNRASKNIHPDLHFLLPLAGAKSLSSAFYGPWREAIAENPWMNVFQWTRYSDMEGKQVDIHKADIQQVTGDLSLEAYEGGNKVIIIWMAQFLAREGNRLLKLIEEPPEQTYFMLISNQQERILPTIRSRCMQIYFPPMEAKEISTLLATVYDVKEEAAEVIARQSFQDMGRALTLAKNTLMDFKDEMASWFRAVISRKGQDIAAWADQMGRQDKEEQKQFALFATSFVRNIVWDFAQTGEMQNVDGKEMIQYMHSHYAPDVWPLIILGLQQTHEKVTRNANTKLLWLALSITVKNQLTAHRLQHINA